ncbi:MULTISPECIES: hypothetical protein [unclassified Pseudofrankia]|uniref:hypothetical protein n=1 Tax=unclassified Pseudofrankia TaxID=2994372 RepID=UPI0008DA8A48|nr:MULTISPECIES: hypothetical protein [unclassified Pseudofrankia]MDT3438639.1 hypothetical protein [Pseudofrankia sp. BMG5.37]OHV49374.1 hypothetical protein BCD48_13125 [Pseudofrankia sp. BMG5.36]
MSIFASQFDRARVYTGMYTGRPDDTTWRTPRGAATGGGGLLAGGVVAALAAGGVVAGLAAAAAVDAFFDGDADAGAHHDAHADPHQDGPAGAHSDGHADAMADAHAGAENAAADEVSGTGSQGADGADADGANAHGHADAWGAGWGDGWDDGWDAESSHRLAAGGHAGTTAAGHETDMLGRTAGSEAHQLFTETTAADADYDSQGRGESGPTTGHTDPGHLHAEGTESPHTEGTENPDGSGSGYDGSGYDTYNAADHVHTGHEEAWAHQAGHTDVGFGGDGDFPSFHDAGS